LTGFGFKTIETRGPMLVGAAMVISTEDGERTLRWPAPMQPAGGDPAAAEHRLIMKFGEVLAFLR
jgi:hypothetical protein